MPWYDLSEREDWKGIIIGHWSYFTSERRTGRMCALIDRDNQKEDGSTVCRNWSRHQINDAIFFISRTVKEGIYCNWKKKTDFHPKTRDLYLPVLTKNDMRINLPTVGYSSSSIVLEWMNQSAFLSSVHHSTNTQTCPKLK